MPKPEPEPSARIPRALASLRACAALLLVARAAGQRRSRAHASSPSRPAAPAASTTRTAAASPRSSTRTCPSVRATAEVTAASVDNLKLIRDGKADIAFTLADTLADAVAGRGAVRGRPPVPAASLAVLYSNYTQIVTLASSGITSIADLRGKVVSTGSPGSGTEVIAFRVLRAAGLDPDRTCTRQGLGVSESADALKDGKIDAFFWSGGLPTPSVQDLSHTSGHHDPHDPERRPRCRRSARVRRPVFPARHSGGRLSRRRPRRSRSSASPTCSSSTARCRTISPTRSPGDLRAPARARRDPSRGAQPVAQDRADRLAGGVSSRRAAILHVEAVGRLPASLVAQSQSLCRFVRRRRDIARVAGIGLPARDDRPARCRSRPRRRRRRLSARDAESAARSSRPTQ